MSSRRFWGGLFAIWGFLSQLIVLGFVTGYPEVVMAHETTYWLIEGPLLALIPVGLLMAIIPEKREEGDWWL